MEVLMRIIPDYGVLTLLSEGIKWLIRDPTLLESIYERIHLRVLRVIDLDLLLMYEDQLILWESQVRYIGLKGGHFLQSQFDHAVVCPGGDEFIEVVELGCFLLHHQSFFKERALIV